MIRTTYRQLQPEERMRIEIWKAENVSLQDMSRRLGRAPSTVSRELSRNADAAKGYAAMSAQGAHAATPVHPPGTQAQHGRRAVGRGAADAGLEVVAPGNRRYAQANLPCRPPPPCVPRDHLQRHLRPTQGGAAPRTHRLPAPRTRQAHAALAGHGSARSNPGHAQHPRAPA